ncbi:MAG TPA: hypothetical protein VHD83_17530 [Puia sp.]|nr:hypothetical protein [Puia sp.]
MKKIMAIAGLLCSVQVMAQLRYKVGFLGAPSWPRTEWNDSNMQRMRALGFNTMQLNIAWGYRPGGEALNLEDVVGLPAGQRWTAGDSVYMDSLRRPGQVAERGRQLRQRIGMCRKYGFRTIFHFGAPCVLYPAREPLDQCISDEAVVARYVALIREFHARYPGVDDLLCYTYDQNAWLCSEFGPCPRCHGVPLPQRVAKFVNELARTWRSLNPHGIFWWEPWELSAGETYRAVDLLDSTCTGLSIHSDIAEVQVALPADRWFRNIVVQAKERKMPVIGEVWTGGPTEEVEPYLHIAAPLATLHALRAVAACGPDGIKEYYGNVPDKEDPNLRMTGIFFHEPGIGDDVALAELAKPYGAAAAKDMALYWRLASEAIALYPWDVSWLAREIGRSDPAHLLTAAVLKGASWQTPSWQSTRRTSFMRTDDTAQPNFWMREDIQLRCEQAALKMEAAIKVASGVRDKAPSRYRDVFVKSMYELDGVKKRTLAYAYHLRETNLAEVVRSGGIRREHVDEMRSLLEKDRTNQGGSPDIDAALRLLDQDSDRFFATYFLPTGPSGRKEGWTITSQ